jgi:cytochrome P450
VVPLGFPAAARDPAALDHADTLIIERAINRHAAFEPGIHRCVGSNVARLEWRLEWRGAIEEFIRRHPAFELSDPAALTQAPGRARGPRSFQVTSLA